MKTKQLTAGLATAVTLAGAITACGGASDASPPVIVLSRHPGAGSTEVRATRVIALHVASVPHFGTYLVANGRTLYMYPPDRRRSVTCTASKSCATAWPPLFVPSGDRVRAGVGVRQRLIGTIPGDGGTVVTYDKWPLYFYIGDRKPGQLSGQGQGFDWYVIAPDGVPIRRNLS